MQTLMKPQSTKYLTGIIPNTWIETIFEYDKFYLIHVSGDTATDEEWESYKNELVSEFGDNVEHIYQLPDDKLKFEVYLRKDN